MEKLIMYLTTPPFGHPFNKLKGNVVAFCILLFVCCFLPVARAQEIPTSIFGNYEGEATVEITMMGTSYTMSGVIVTLKKTDTENDYVLQFMEFPYLDLASMDKIIITPFGGGYKLSRAEPVTFIIPVLPIPPIPVFLPEGGIFYDVPATITLENSYIVNYVMILNLKMAVTINVGVPLSIPFFMNFEGTLENDTLRISTTEVGRLNVYPNPTTGELQVTSYELQVTGIEIFDISGRKILTKFPSVIPNAVRNPEHYGPQADGVVINISHLPAGVYFLRMGNQRVKVVKL